MTNKPYHSFSTEDFLNDKDFLRYVKYNGTEDVMFWNQWEGESPANLAAYREAHLQLQLILSDQPVSVSEFFKDKLLTDINSAINQLEQRKKKRTAKLWWLSGAAASVFIISTIAWYFNSTVVIRTHFGENVTVHLPDGSDVKLNANSVLSYPRAFNWKAKREVKLLGEGYFKVKHLNVSPDEIKKGELFMASTTGLQVQVLGTEFNLKERRNLANVALVKGKIQVTAIKTGASYIMQPGDFIHFDENGKKLTTALNAGNETAWLSGKIIVSQTTVNEIIKDFEDLYGYHVVLDSPALGEKKIDGTISIRSEETLLFTLKNILNVNIKKEGKTIYLKNRQ